MSTTISPRSMRFLNFALLIVNVSALVTILLSGNGAGDTPQSPDIRSVTYLQEKLKLTPEQYQEVIRMSERTFYRYNKTLDLICEANISLLEEMARQDPDQVQLTRQTRRIGRMHTNLKNLTVEYFASVRSICTQDQNAQLAILFKDIMQLETQCQQCDREDCPSKERINQFGKQAIP